MSVVRCQGGVALGAGCLVVVALGHLFPLEPVRVVGRPDVRTVVWPLIPALAGLAVPIGAVARFDPWSGVAARPAWAVRGAFIAAVVVAGAVTVALAPVDRSVVARNLALFDGIALVTVAVAGRPPWGLLVGLPVLVWFTGVDPPDVIRWWAVPLLPPGHIGAAAVAAGTAVVGVVLHVAWPPRWALGERS